LPLPSPGVIRRDTPTEVDGSGKANKKTASARGWLSKDSERSARFISRLSRPANFARQFAEATISSFSSGCPPSFPREETAVERNSIVRSVHEYFIRAIDTPDDIRCIRYGSFRNYGETFSPPLPLFYDAVIIASRSYPLHHFSRATNSKLEARQTSDFIGTAGCAGAAKRKEPEIVAQMNLKYCRSTSLHLSPVARPSFQLSIILSFVRASACALRAERCY